jgi:Arc/MetJ family transcription regulator
MRISIEIDNQLMDRAMRVSGARTKKAAVEAGLRLLIETHSQAAMRKLRGKIKWEEALNTSRQ